VLTVIVKRRVAALVVGVMALALGVVMLSASTVTCGDETMYEGDVCESNGAGSTVVLTYEEQKRSDQRNARLLVGIGAAGLLLAAVGYSIVGVGHLRTRRRPS
jgi:hypothetical protein